MSTTNPPAGPNNPGGDAPRPTTGPTPGQGPGWPRGGADAPDDHGGGGGVDPAAIRAGHEPDVFAVRPILSIPAAVVATFVVAFAVALGAFAYFMWAAPKVSPFVHPEAVARNDAPLNTRLERVEREGLRPNDKREMDQPRLEPLRRLEGDGKYYVRPEMPTGNSPFITWEDIHPYRVAALQAAGFVDGKKEFARIPIADAMAAAVADKGMFPVRKEPSRPVGSAHRPSYPAAGRGVVPPPPKGDTKAEQKEPGKAEPGKTEPAKAPEPKPGEPKPPEKK